MAKDELELSDDGYCFGCGRNNPIGLKLDFVETSDGGCVARFTPGPEYQGWEGITHGGILTTLADEAMGRLVWMKGIRAVTAEMTIKFKRPARSGTPLTITGAIEGEEGRVLDCRSEIKGPDGTLIAEATAKMVRV